MAQTGLKVAMARVEYGQAPWPPQHGSSNQHTRLLQGRHVIVVISVRTCGAAGRRWRRQTWQRRDVTGRRRRRRQQYHAAGHRRAADCRHYSRHQVHDKSRPSALLPSPPLLPQTAGTGAVSPSSTVGGWRFTVRVA